jgi:hypothetical protein
MMCAAIHKGFNVKQSRHLIAFNKQVAIFGQGRKQFDAHLTKSSVLMDEIIALQSNIKDVLEENSDPQMIRHFELLGQEIVEVQELI